MAFEGTPLHLVTDDYPRRIAEVKAQFDSWGLTDDTIKSLGWIAISNAEALKILGRYNSKEWYETRDGILIPCFNEFGMLVCHRIRWLGDPPAPPEVHPPNKSREQFEDDWAESHKKYAGRKNDPTPVFIPPAMLKLKHPTLVITEGEAKAACGTQYGVPTLGLCGWNGGDKKWELKGTLEYFVTHPETETVSIIWDSDAAPNSTSKKPKKEAAFRAMMRLGLQIANAAKSINKKLNVRYGFVPSLRDDYKTGLDDYLKAGHDYQKLIDSCKDLRDVIEASAFQAACIARGPYIEDEGAFYVPSLINGVGGYQSAHDFEAALAPYKPLGGVVDMVTGRKRHVRLDIDYMTSPFRYARRYAEWNPGEGPDLPNGGYNTYVDDAPELANDPEANRLIDAHLELFIPDEQQRSDWWTWIAHVHQFPGEVHDILLHLYGSGGSGKSLWPSLIMRSLSINGRNTRLWDQIGGRFEESLIKSLCSFADELNIETWNIGVTTSYLRKAVSSQYISLERKNIQGNRPHLNLAAKIVSQNPPGPSISGADNRRNWCPDIPRDTANNPTHPCRVAATALGKYFEANAKLVAGTIRHRALSVLDVKEKYVALKGHLDTATATEVSASSNYPVVRAREFIEDLPEDIEVMEVKRIKDMPPYVSMSEGERNSEFQRNTEVMIHLNGGKTVSVGTERLRIRVLRNPSKWKPGNYTPEELKAQLDLAAKLAGRKF